MSKVDTQVCILAGGRGTRLKSAVPTMPKILAPVLNQTFLDFMIDYLYCQGMYRVVFLLGYMHEVIVQYIKKNLLPSKPRIEITISVEPEPLGTAGALKFASNFLDTIFFLINGDSYLEFQAQQMLRKHRDTGAMATIAICEVEDTSRFGSIEMSPDGHIISFCEKDASRGYGFVNAGIYLLNREIVTEIPTGELVSIEKETFPMLIANGKKIVSVIQNGPFIDIGTPESYQAFIEMVQQGRWPKR
jgi:NDP-sugar pyrophosphorylase family protein